MSREVKEEGITIKIKEISGNKLNSRYEGKQLRNIILNKSSTSIRLTLDFEGVQSISQGFADECFGIIVKDIGLKRFREVFNIINIQNNVRDVIRYVCLKRVGYR